MVRGTIVFLAFGNTLSSNMGKRMLQMDTVIDSFTKSRSVMQCLQSTDIGYGRVESKKAIEGLNLPRSLIVGTIESNRVNLRIIFIRLCSILLFL